MLQGYVVTAAISVTTMAVTTTTTTTTIWETQYIPLPNL